MGSLDDVKRELESGYSSLDYYHSDEWNVASALKSLISAMIMRTDIEIEKEEEAQS